jgi:hypothetical protein
MRYRHMRSTAWRHDIGQSAVAAVLAEKWIPAFFMMFVLRGLRYYGSKGGRYDGNKKGNI